MSMNSSDWVKLILEILRIIVAGVAGATASGFVS